MKTELAKFFLFRSGKLIRSEVPVFQIINDFLRKKAETGSI